ncbi:hypothetical protein ACO0QE_001346 [Hanseniaspora vineae]
MDAALSKSLEAFFLKMKVLLDETTFTSRDANILQDDAVKTIILMFQVFAEHAVALKNLFEPYIENGELGSKKNTQWTAFGPKVNTAFSNEQTLFIDVLCLLNTIRTGLILQSTNKLEKDSPQLVQLKGIIKTINKSSVQNKILNKTSVNGDKFYYDVAKVLEAVQPHVDIIHASTTLSPVKVDLIEHQVNSLKQKVAHTVKKHKVDFILGIV